MPFNPADWRPVESSNLDAVRFVLGEWLDIRFKSGAVYRYYGVSPAVYQALLAAPSKGKYHHQNIKGKYQFAKL